MPLRIGPFISECKDHHKPGLSVDLDTRNAGQRKTSQAGFLTTDFRCCMSRRHL
jgi:hypothetical protein